MTLVISVFVPTGIVLAADSRTTIQSTATRQTQAGTESIHTPLVLSDSAFKLQALPSSGVGILTYGEAFARELPVESHLRRFTEQFDRPEHSVAQMSELLYDYFRSHFPDTRVLFIVAGHVEEEGLRVPHVYAVDPCSDPGVRRSNVNADGRLQHGVLRGGDTAVVDRLITPDCLPPFHLMPLPDAIDYARFLLATTIESLRFEPRFPSVGGPVDILTITPGVMRFEQRKGQAGPENIRLIAQRTLHG